MPCYENVADPFTGSGSDLAEEVRKNGTLVASTGQGPSSASSAISRGTA
jgi:hypothetical protein